MAQEGEDVLVHSGFRSWMGSITPTLGTQNHVVYEMPADTPLQAQQEAIELPAGDVHHEPQPSPPAPPTPYPPGPTSAWQKPAPVPAPKPAEPEPEPLTQQPDPVVTIVVNGLQKAQQPGFFEEKLDVSFYTTLPKINDMLVRKGLRTTHEICKFC